MKTMITSLILASLLWSGCTEVNPTYTPPVPEEPVTESTGFALGADISWTTQLESEGEVFYNADGQNMECTALMKDLGMNAIRLRVWVDPEGNWCSKSDVVAKALRAQKLGMRIMIDFHYSDTWADPGKQVIPAAWLEYADDTERLAEAVAEHTREVLTLLKDNGIDVEWVQVGNETTNGMMYDSSLDENGEAVRLENGGGYVRENPENYAAYTKAGCEAVKAVYPEALTVVHVDQGHNLERGAAVFKALEDYDVDYDIIGLSLYPNGAEERIGQCVENITKLHGMYGHDVMICETGMAYDDPDAAYSQLSELISGAMASGHCLGVFYWEPEAPAGYNGGYNMGAFEGGAPTHNTFSLHSRPYSSASCPHWGRSAASAY